MTLRQYLERPASWREYLLLGVLAFLVGASSFYGYSEYIRYLVRDEIQRSEEAAP